MSTLDDMIAALEAMGGEDVERRIAKHAAVTLKEALEETLTAGEDPEGVAWVPTKPGGRAYKGAPKSLDVKAYNNVIRATIQSPYTYGQFGSGRLPRRQMLPEGGEGMPKSVSGAIEKATTLAMEEVAAGKK